MAFQNRTSKTGANLSWTLRDSLKIPLQNTKIFSENYWLEDEHCEKNGSLFFGGHWFIFGFRFSEKKRNLHLSWNADGGASSGKLSAEASQAAVKGSWWKGCAKVKIQLGGGNWQLKYFFCFHSDFWGRWTQFDEYCFKIFSCSFVKCLVYLPIFGEFVYGKCREISRQFIATFSARKGRPIDG